MDVPPLESLRSVLYIVARAVALLLASMLISALTPAFVQLVRGLTSRLESFRNNLLYAAKRGLGKWWKEHWEERKLHPRRPLVVHLDRIAHATEGLSERQTATISKLQSDVVSAVESVARTTIKPQGNVTVQAHEMVDATVRGRRALALLFFLVIVTFGLIAFNTVMVNEFLEAFLGTRPILPYPLPQVSFSLLLALFFALIEVASGVVIHAVEEYGEERPLLDAGRYVAYLVIAAFMITEAIAYGVLSSRLDVPSLLGVSDDSAFYPILRYFLSAIGLTVPPMLAVLGYAAWTALDEWRKAVGERKAKRYLNRLAATAQSVGRRIQQAQSKLEALQDQVAGFTPNLLEDFRRAVGASEECTNVASYLRTRVEELLSPDTAESRRLQVRTRMQVLAAMLVDLLTLLMYLALGWILATTIYNLVVTRYPGSSTVALSVALIITAGLALLGYFGRDAYVGSGYAAVIQNMLPEPKARRSALLVILFLMVLGITASSWIAGAGRLIDNHVVLSGLLGFFLASTFTALSWNIDSCLLSLADTAYLCGIVATWTGTLIIYAVCFLMEAALGFIAWLAEILGLPGRLALRLFRPRTAAQGS